MSSPSYSTANLYQLNSMALSSVLWVHSTPSWPHKGYRNSLLQRSSCRNGPVVCCSSWAFLGSIVFTVLSWQLRSCWLIRRDLWIWGPPVTWSSSLIPQMSHECKKQPDPCYISSWSPVPALWSLWCLVSDCSLNITLTVSMSCPCMMTHYPSDKPDVGCVVSVFDLRVGRVDWWIRVKDWTHYTTLLFYCSLLLYIVTLTVSYLWQNDILLLK